MSANVGGRMGKKRFRVADISKASNSYFGRKPTNIPNVSRLATLDAAHTDTQVWVSAKNKKTKPYIKNGTELIIPHDSADKYRWWAGGQSVLDTLVELNASDEIIGNYVGKILTPDAWRKWQVIQEEHRNALYSTNPQK